ncbi:MAG TPA: hypothetical protein VL688_03510 [Verrucomicrobiae bacterium]|nr:hypothetical protein [Verrucomicrobiae bacterium]
MKKSVSLLAAFFLVGFAPCGFADVTIYATNENDAPIDYTLVVPPTMDVDGSPTGTIDASQEKGQLVSLSSDGEDPEEETIELKFHDSEQHFLCSAKFFSDMAKLADNPAASNDEKASCSVQTVEDGFLLTVSKAKLQADLNP